jgi:hypothetical protein
MSDSGPTCEAIDRLWTGIDRREDELIETVAELVRRPRPIGRSSSTGAESRRNSDTKLSLPIDNQLVQREACPAYRIARRVANGN